VEPLDAHSRQLAGVKAELQEVEQCLGIALGYPYYSDDPKNFPNATIEDGVCVGEHTAGTLAAEAQARIATLTTERDEYRRNYENLQIAAQSVADKLEKAERQLVERVHNGS
jgi:hypothetical protein